MTFTKIIEIFAILFGVVTIARFFPRSSFAQHMFRQHGSGINPSLMTRQDLFRSGKMFSIFGVSSLIVYILLFVFLMKVKLLDNPLLLAVCFALILISGM